MKRIITIMGLLAFIVAVNGCAVIFQSGRRSDIERIKSLEQELDELRQARSSLEERLSQEIQNEQVKLSMQEKGLVITFVAEVLFDSGKAELKKDSLPILEKVATILREEVPENNIGIEGHTDNQPIKHSNWKSNWELSAHRALSVLHYLEDQGVASERLSAIGYGSQRSVASNDSKEGKQLNRRVEVVIIPKTVKKIEKKYLTKDKDEDIQGKEEELK
ncbi:MAG: OmpA family protein [Candidatus Omnitrophota bacterium]|nr:OmpA family protein [Candidatus Omnitrophota bacterium]